MISTTYKQIQAQSAPMIRTALKEATAVSVRQASTDTDALAIATISRAGFAATHQKAFMAVDLTSYLAGAFNRNRIIAEMSDPRTHFLVAEVDGVIVGTVRLSQTRPPHPIRLADPLELSRLYLEPQWMGRGIGSALMRYALATAVASKHKSCWLAVWEGNSQALGFYRRWGFRLAGTDSLLVGQSCPIGLVMTRTLQSADQFAR